MMLKQIAKTALSVISPRYRPFPNYWRIRRFLARAQWWDAATIERWQVERLRRIVAYAIRNVPGYRELYARAGVRAADIRSLEDARALPFVTKSLLRDNLKDFTARGIPRFLLKYVSTGGSTGIPFGFYQTGLATSTERAFMHAGWERAGWRLGETLAVLRGAFVGDETRHWEYRHYERELWLSSYYLTEVSYPSYDQILARSAPRHLHAYPSILAILSDLIIRRGKHFPDFSVLLLGSEGLYDWQKLAFAKAFPGSRIFSWYGQTEQVILAPMCEKSDDYHAWPFYGWTEVLDESGREVPPGAAGELVGTSFWNHGTPFIRYKTMDLATRGASKCAWCGRNGLVLPRIEGRLQEVIVTRSGRLISMTCIASIHDNVFDALKQFQFYQDTPGRVLFRYVPRGALSSSEIDRIRQGLMAKLGADMELQLSAVEEIRRTPSGKLLFLEQKLPIRPGAR